MKQFRTRNGNRSHRALSLHAYMCACVLVVCNLTACDTTDPNSNSAKNSISIGVKNGALADCPSSPNCLSSSASDADHMVQAFVLADADALGVAQPISDADKQALAEKRQAVVDAVKAQLLQIPGGAIKSDSRTDAQHYIHATVTSDVFEFVDDVELLLDWQAGEIQVRSASRTGWHDLGANESRVEALHVLLKRAGVVQP